MKIKDSIKVNSAKPEAVCFAVDPAVFAASTKQLQQPSLHTYGCLFSDQQSMNAALLRSGLYLYTQQGVVNDAAFLSSPYHKMVAGHDLMSNDLRRYLNARSKDKRGITLKQQSAPVLAMEQQFWHTFLLPKLKRKADFFLFAVFVRPALKENLSHELLHAQYYQLPTLRHLLRDIWQHQVSAVDRATIIQALAKGGYDTRDQELVLREFLSYCLQYRAKSYVSRVKPLATIAPLITKYARIIVQTARQKGITLISVEASDASNPAA